DPFDESDPLLEPELDCPDANAGRTGSAASKTTRAILVPGCWNRDGFRILRQASKDRRARLSDRYFAGQRRSSVSGKSRLCSSGGASSGPGVCPNGRKREIRRPSASSALAGRCWYASPPGFETWYVQPAIERPFQVSITSKTSGA